jgi:hypothetical protein
MIELASVGGAKCDHGGYWSRTPMNRYRPLLQVKLNAIKDRVAVSSMSIEL